MVKVFDAEYRGAAKIGLMCNLKKLWPYFFEDSDDESQPSFALISAGVGWSLEVAYPVIRVWRESRRAFFAASDRISQFGLKGRPETQTSAVAINRSKICLQKEGVMLAQSQVLVRNF